MNKNLNMKQSIILNEKIKATDHHNWNFIHKFNRGVKYAVYPKLGKLQHEGNKWPSWPPFR